MKVEKINLSQLLSWLSGVSCSRVSWSHVALDLFFLPLLMSSLMPASFLFSQAAHQFSPDLRIPVPTTYMLFQVSLLLCDT